MQRLPMMAPLIGASVVMAASCGPGSGPTMCERIEEMAWESDYGGGQWEPDWDDAAFYGPAFYSHVGWEEDDAQYRQRAVEAIDRNLEEVIGPALDGPADLFLENMTEILYATLGVMEYMDATGDTSGMESIDGAIDTANNMSRVLSNDYFEGFSNYAMDTYGPTVVTAMLAIVNLQYAVLLDTPRVPDRVGRASEILARIDEMAWNGSFYQFSPERTDELFLYPNIIMMIAQARMYQATGDEAHLGRATSLHAAIEPLRCPHRPGYHSPYSAGVMGATTDDYTTLSSMNYSMFAFGLLAQVTGEPVYREELDSILDFIEDYLFVQEDGKLYHHWMDGRLAVPGDPEYYCIGCNLQLLYVTWWVEHNLD